MIDSFSATEFEAALPVHKVSGKRLFESLGIVDGEYTYFVPVSENAGIVVRSSVKSDGYSAETGKDSIRLWLVDPKEHTPIGSKLSKYVTRVPGWEERLTAQLRILYRYALQVKQCKCGDTIVPFKVTKDGPNKGRFFWKCRNRECQNNTFEWIE